MTTVSERNLVVTTTATFSGASVLGLVSVARARTVVEGGSYTIPATDQIVAVNYAGAVALTLPAANTMAVGQELFIKDEGGNALTYPISVTPAEGNTIGDGTYTSFSLQNKDEGLCVYSDGFSVWFVR